MTTFYLQKDKTNRVFLHDEVIDKNTVIQTIEADNWGEARDEIKDIEFDHYEGYGFYVS